MKNKKKFNKVLKGFGLVLTMPIALICAVGMVIYVPIDYIKYKFSHYRKDNREKYTFLCGFLYPKNEEGSFLQKF